MARLGDICTIISGTTPKSTCAEYWDGNISWVTPAELTNDSDIIYESQRKITEQAVIDSSLKSFPAGTVLLSSRAPIGKVAIAGREMYCNQGFKNLICSEVIYNRYLFHFLKSKTDYLNSLGRGATFKEISKSIVENIEIPLPPLEKQRKIAAVLDKISDLIVKRREQLDKLDLLVKSKFIEMFGDPETNPKKWYMPTVAEAVKEGIIAKPLDGNHGNKHPKATDYVKSGIPFIMANNLVGGKVDQINCSFISKKQADSLDKGFAQDGDVLLTHKGTIGRTAILHCDLPYVMLTPQVTYYRPLNGVTAEYLKAYFDTYYFQSEMMNIAGAGSTRAYIGITAQQNLKLVIPPRALQDQFVAFVQQADKSKFEIQQSLKKLETLKKSLMQQYFG